MISLSHVSFSYSRKVNVLRDISFETRPGRVTVLIGVNGAGKTTLFDLIAGSLPRPLGVQGCPSLAHIAYQLQNVPILPTLKGKDLVRLILTVDGYGATHGGRTRVTTVKALEEQPLVGRLWNRRIGDMSVGERRFLLVASMLRLQRQLYIFDEPTANVDPLARSYLLAQFARLAQDSTKTVLLSTQILTEVEDLAAWMVLLHNGTILFTGTADDFLYQSHAHSLNEALQWFVEQNPLWHP